MRNGPLTVIFLAICPMIVAQEPVTGSVVPVAQQSQPVSTPPAVPAKPNTLVDGTPIKLRIGRNVSSADAKVGEVVDFEVLE